MWQLRPQLELLDGSPEPKTVTAEQDRLYMVKDDNQVHQLLPSYSFIDGTAAKKTIAASSDGTLYVVKEGGDSSEANPSAEFCDGPDVDPRLNIHRQLSSSIILFFN